MYKREFAVFFMIGVLFVSLVSFSGCAKEEAEEVQTGAFYVGGQSGLGMKFIEGQPPDKFFEGDIVDIVVQLENKGEFDIDKGDIEVIISGIPPGSAQEDDGFEYSLTNSDPLIGIKRIGEIITLGAFEDLDFGTVSYTIGLPPGADPVPRNIFAKGCYMYGANATSNACIREDIYAATTGAQICEVNEEKRVETSAGPIKVAKVQELARGPNKISFTVTLENRGSGDVYWNTAEELRCGNILFSDMNKLLLKNIELVGLEDKDPEFCTGVSEDGVIRLGAEEIGSFVCVWNTTGEEAYETFMNIDLEYMYTVEALKQVNIISL
jgi:hypothetical protein